MEYKLIYNLTRKYKLIYNLTRNWYTDFCVLVVDETYFTKIKESCPENAALKLANNLHKRFYNGQPIEVRHNDPDLHHSIIYEFVYENDSWVIDKIERNYGFIKRISIMHGTK